METAKLCCETVVKPQHHYQITQSSEMLENLLSAAIKQLIMT